MSDPSREGPPLTRRQARETSHTPQAPILPAADDVVGDARETGPSGANPTPPSSDPSSTGPVPAPRALPWDEQLFRPRADGPDAVPGPSPVPAARPSASDRPAPDRPEPHEHASRVGNAPSEGREPSERSEPATLAETAALATHDPDPVSEPASLEDLFVPENTVHTKQRRGGRGCLVTLVILLLIVGGVVAGGFYLANTYGPQIAERLGWDGPSDYEEGEATGEAVITIEEGDGGEAISVTLHEAGVTLKPDSFYDHLIEIGKVPTFYPGVYQLQQKMTSEAALAAIEDPANRLENSVALQEGWTVAGTLDAAAAGLQMPIEELEAAAADPSQYGVEGDTLEGWLFPAHYTFDPGVTAEQVVAAMVERTRESLERAGVPEGEEHRVLTVASIVQREGSSAEDFGMVARVIYNRLDPEISDTGGLLQMDSTAQFGYRMTHGGEDQESVFSTEEQLNDPNPWNTYVHAGLPVGPIANPGDDAIAAAMSPTEGPWQYFVTVDLETGETLFAETYAEQQRNEARLREWCQANPDHGGC